MNNVFSVKYYINLVLVDEEDRRYFKQQEIIFWRCNEYQNTGTGVGTGVGVGPGGGGGNIKNSFLPSTYHMTVVDKKVNGVHTNDTATDHIKV